MNPSNKVPGQEFTPELVDLFLNCCRFLTYKVFYVSMVGNVMPLILFKDSIGKYGFLSLINSILFRFGSKGGAGRRV